ncbi:unnamed protein product [Clonostachys solani]|uniref:Plastidal glycolate/glycerate translocator 1 n=1 Tax=Clonostachys solani TaxID=160281 RepID=A0A9N9YWT1_9HYPO|nr:unnamed protein product [Clonostachys solani]
MPGFRSTKPPAVLCDGLGAAKIAITSSAHKLFRSWILVPIGILVNLAACFGVDSLLRKVNVSFPASVFCLVLLFVGLIISEVTLGSHRTRRLISVIDISAGWSLQWISVFFTPSFVLLALSPPIGIAEVLKIIAVFLIGFFIMMAMAAYLTRAVQLLLGSSKRGHTQRAEDLSDGIVLADNSAALSGHSGPPSLSHYTAPSVEEDIESPIPSRPQTPPQMRLQGHHHGEHVAPEHAFDALIPTHNQTPVPTPRPERWAALLVSHMDFTTFGLLFLFVGIPVYYSTGYAMPLHLTINVLAYFAAMSLPSRWKTYLHPVLVSSLITVLVVWAFTATAGSSLTSALHQYRTGAKYIQLWRQASRPSGQAALLPGAGDMFSTLLDASITALALPMFQHRRELRAHWAALIIPNVSISIASLFAYPPLCYAIGITAQRSLAFASRSLTLALATPATENLGGDVNTAAALAIISGILGVVSAPWFLRLLGIPEDEYVARGITLGVNSSAIATALLLRTDPRAAALSSLSMILFGTVTVLFTSIPPIATVVRAMVGLGAL